MKQLFTLRHLGHLALLMLAFLILAVPEALACGNTKPDVFPFMAPTCRESSYAENGFRYAWQIFEIIADSNHALYYVTLFAALFGVISIVVNKKFQKGSTIFAWLVLIILLMFAPVNSNLAFIKVSGEKNQSTGINTEVKGFAPQVLAVHITSSLQQIFIDFFDGQGFTNIIEMAQISQEFHGLDELQASDGTLGTYRTFKAGNCGETPLKLQADALQDFTTLGSVFNKIENYYDNIDSVNLPQPPPIIVLPVSRGEQPWFGNMTEEARYLAGISALYEQLDFTNPRQIVTFNGEGDTLKVEAAVDNIMEIAKRGGVISPSKISFHLAKHDTTNVIDIDSEAYKGRIATSKDTLRCNEQAAIPTVGAPGGYVAPLKCRFRKPVYAEKANFFAQDNAIQNFKIMLNSSPDIQQMPVLLAYLPVVASTIDETLAIDSRVVPIQGCGSEASHIVRETLRDVFKTRVQSRDVAEKNQFFKLVYEGSSGGNNAVTWPAKNSAGKLQPLANSQTTQLRGFWGLFGGNAYFNTLADYYNRAILPQLNNLEPVPSAAEARYMYIDHLVNAAILNAQRDNKETKAREQAAQDAFDPEVIGGPAGLLGAVGKIVAGVGVAVIAPFIGAMSVIIIMFIKIALNLVLLGTILVTPLAFIMGVAVPGYALGVILLTTMLVFVAKFVPIAFMFIDNVLSIMYKVVLNT